MADYKNIAEPSPFLVNVKRSCLMLAREKCIRKLMETPKRENSFFTHLNEDVRKKIYGYLTLFPFKDCIETSGLFLSCRQAKLEIEQEAVRSFWLYLKEMEPTLGTLDRGFGYFDFLNTHVFGVRQTPPLLRSINNKLDLAGVKSLTVIVDDIIKGPWGFESYHFPCMCELMKLRLDTLRIHFQGANDGLIKNKSMSHIAHMLLMYGLSGFSHWEVSPVKVKTIIVSWDFYGLKAPSTHILFGTTVVPDPKYADILVGAGVELPTYYEYADQWQIAGILRVHSDTRWAVKSFEQHNVVFNDEWRRVDTIRARITAEQDLDPGFFEC